MFPVRRKRLPFDYVNCNKSLNSQATATTVSTLIFQSDFVSAVNSKISLKEADEIEPKVQLPFVPKIGTTPRRLEVERRKRLYLNQDLLALFIAYGFYFSDDGKLVFWADCSAPLDNLEIYDDQIFEERSEIEWKRLACLKGSFDLPCRIFYNGKWVDASAVDFSNGKWLIDLIDFKAWFHKIWICFKAENPSIYIKRFVSSCCRLLLSTQSSPVSIDTLVSFPLPSAERLLKPIGAQFDSKALSDHLISECKQIISDSLVRLSTVHNESILNLLSKLYSKDIDLKFYYSSDDVHFPGFVSCRKTISRMLYFANPDLLNLLIEYKNEADRILFDNCVVHFAPPEHDLFSFDKFVEYQKQEIKRLGVFVKDEFIPRLKIILQKRFESIGKGWFNIDENKMDMYLVSRMFNCMNLVALILRDSITSVVYETLDRAINVFSPENTRLLFELNINCSKDQCLVIDIDFQSIENGVLDLLKEYIKCFHNLPRMEHLIMTKMKWIEKYPLRVLFETDDSVQLRLHHLKKNLKSVFSVLEKKMEEFRVYEPRIQKNRN